MSTSYNVVLISVAAVLLISRSSSMGGVEAWIQQSSATVPTRFGSRSLDARSSLPDGVSRIHDKLPLFGTIDNPPDATRSGGVKQPLGGNVQRTRTLGNWWSRRFSECPRSRSSRLFRALNDSEVDNKDSSSSWSSKGSGESRLGVRRRVKNVLQRAKQRTGIQNSSEYTATELKTKQSSFAIVAESASIGGLGGVVVDDQGTVDVALELADKKQQSIGSNGAAGSTAPINGATSPSATAPSPEEEFVMASSVPYNSTDRPARQLIASDMPAAVDPFLPDPLPFTLPELTKAQKERLLNDERVQEQSKMGREGSGYVVLDVKAPPYVIWECLLDFQSYTETIPTVRDVTLYTSQHLQSGYHKEKPVQKGTNVTLPVRHYGTPSVTRAAFVLSKFRLNIAAIHTYRPHPDGDHMVFTLDPECTNLVLRNAKGVWHTQSNPDGRGEEYTRVWLLCEVSVSKILPSFIVDYTAKKAMPRATTWLKPQVEAAARLWLKK